MICLVGHSHRSIARLDLPRYPVTRRRSKTLFEPELWTAELDSSISYPIFENSTLPEKNVAERGHWDYAVWATVRLPSFSVGPACPSPAKVGAKACRPASPASLVSLTFQQPHAHQQPSPRSRLSLPSYRFIIIPPATRTPTSSASYSSSFPSGLPTNHVWFSLQHESGFLGRLSREFFSLLAGTRNFGQFPRG
jgi:hypothetical protein